MKKKFWARRSVAFVFAVIAVAAGFWFLDSGFTGNAIVNKQVPINLLSIIGLLLITCSIILISYSVKKK